MSRLINELLKEFGVKNVLSYVRARTPRQDYVGPVLFPELNTRELTFEYVQAQNRLPIQATVQAFGAETPIASREGIEKITGSVVKIARKINLDERDMIALRREGLGDKAQVMNSIYNDLDNLIMSVRDRQEAMRIEALSTGAIVLNENGLKMTLDYGMPADHKVTLTSTAKWDAPTTATPLDNIQAWVQKIVDDTGVSPTRALTSNKVVANLLKNTAIRQMIWGDNGATRAISLMQLNQQLTSMGLPIIGVYDAQTRIEDPNTGTKTTRRFLPDNMFILMPSEILGNTLMGPTAESMLSDAISVDEMAGLWGVVYQEADPPAIWTKVSAVSIPTFPGVKEVFAATVQ